MLDAASFKTGAGKTLEALGWLRALGWDCPEVGAPLELLQLCLWTSHFPSPNLSLLICKMGIYLPQSISLMAVNIKCYNLRQWLKILAGPKSPGNLVKKTHKTPQEF